MSLTEPARERGALFESLLERLRDGLPPAELLGPLVDQTRVTELLGPVALADARIGWIRVNGERVDAVVTAGESQWRVVFGCASGRAIDSLDVFERPDRFDGITGGRAVVINGPSGAGKSMLMRAMQQIAGVPFVIFDEPEHIGTVQPEYRIWRDRAPALHRGYLDAIASLAPPATMSPSPLPATTKRNSSPLSATCPRSPSVSRANSKCWSPGNAVPADGAASPRTR